MHLSQFLASFIGGLFSLKRSVICISYLSLFLKCINSLFFILSFSCRHRFNFLKSLSQFHSTFVLQRQFDVYFYHVFVLLFNRICRFLKCISTTSSSHLQHYHLKNLTSITSSPRQLLHVNNNNNTNNFITTILTARQRKNYNNINNNNLNLNNNTTTTSRTCRLIKW